MDSEVRNEATIRESRSLAHSILTSAPEPQTPRRTGPNTSRKRLYSPALFRDTASPSHIAKMSSLFEDAASTLQYARTPSRHPPPNIKKPRIPSHQSRFVRFGSVHDGRLTQAPMVARGYGSDDSNPRLNRQQQENGTLDRSPVHDCPRAPPKLCMAANDRTVCGSLVDVPRPSTFTDPIEIAAAYKANSNAFHNLEAREPISSGFSTPTRNHIPDTDNPTATVKPDVGVLELPPLPPNAHQSDSDDEEHSTHGVRLIMPYSHCEALEAQHATIEAWLEQVLGVTDKVVHKAPDVCHHESEGQSTYDTIVLSDSALKRFLSDCDSDAIGEDQTSLHRLSNKENVPPPLPPRAPPIPYECTTPTQSQHLPNACEAMMRPKSTPSVLRFLHPLTPSGYLSAPPKRAKRNVIQDLNTPSKSMRTSRRDFTIHEDDLAAALAKLSPSVEQHRKGRGPKRERCASYWDTDVLEPGNPAYPNREGSGPTDSQGKLLRDSKRATDETA